MEQNREKNMFDVDFEHLYGELGNQDLDLSLTPTSQVVQSHPSEFDNLFSEFFDSSKVDDSFTAPISGVATSHNLPFSSAFNNIPLTSSDAYDFTSTAPIFDFDMHGISVPSTSDSFGTMLSSPDDDDLLITPPQSMNGFVSPTVETDVPLGQLFPTSSIGMDVPMRPYEKAFDVFNAQDVKPAVFKSVPLQGSAAKGRKKQQPDLETLAIDPEIMSGSSSVTNSPVDTSSPQTVLSSPQMPGRTNGKVVRSTTIERATSVLPNFKSSVPLHIRTPINLDAPTQPRMYITTSSTSRKEIPAFVEKQLARKKYQKRKITTDTIRAAASGVDLSADAALPKKILESIEKKRMQNTMAARRSRLRREEQLKALEDEVTRLREEEQAYKNRWEVSRRMLERIGAEEWVKAHS